MEFDKWDSDFSTIPTNIDDESAHETDESDKFSDKVTVRLTELYMEPERALKLIPDIVHDFVGRRHDFLNMFICKLRKIESTVISQEAVKETYYEVLFNGRFLDMFGHCINGLNKFIEAGLKARSNPLGEDKIVALASHTGTKIAIELPKFMTFNHVYNICGQRDISLHGNNSDTYIIIRPVLGVNELRTIRQLFDISTQELVIYEEHLSTKQLIKKFKSKLAHVTGIYLASHEINVKTGIHFIITWPDHVKLNEYFKSQLIVEMTD